MLGMGDAMMIGMRKGQMDAGIPLWYDGTEGGIVRTQQTRTEHKDSA